MLKEFRAFVLRGNVIDLAVGVVIGAAFKSVVDAFVSGFLNPIVSFAGTGGLADKSFCVGSSTVQTPTGPECAHMFDYGAVLSALISLLLIGAVLFFAVVKPVNHLVHKFRVHERGPETTRECPECLSAIPRAARRCSHCTAVVGAAL